MLCGSRGETLMQVCRCYSRVNWPSKSSPSRPKSCKILAHPKPRVNFMKSVLVRPSSNLSVFPRRCSVWLYSLVNVTCHLKRLSVDVFQPILPKWLQGSTEESTVITVNSCRWVHPFWMIRSPSRGQSLNFAKALLSPRPSPTVSTSTWSLLYQDQRLPFLKMKIWTFSYLTVYLCNFA